MLTKIKSNSRIFIFLILFIPLILACTMAEEKIYCPLLGGKWVEPSAHWDGHCVVPHQPDPAEEQSDDLAAPDQENSPSGEETQKEAQTENPTEVESEGEQPASSDQTDSSSNEVDTSVPDEIYVGTTTLPDYFDDVFANDDYSVDGRTIAENEITIIVSPYREVSGGIIFVWQGDHSAPLDGCVTAINLYSTASLSGQLTETGGTIEIAEDLAQEIWRNGCPAGTEIVYENYSIYQAKVSIIGNRVIRGEVPGYFSFEATK